MSPSGEHLDQPSTVQCVVDFFGPTDFLLMDVQRRPHDMDHSAADSPESELVGGKISEVPEAVARANPATYAASDAPPFLIVHGDDDGLVPLGQSRLLLAALEQAGVPVTLHVVAGGGHTFFATSEVTALTRAFLARHLRPGS